MRRDMTPIAATAALAMAAPGVLSAASYTAQAGPGLGLAIPNLAYPSGSPGVTGMLAHSQTVDAPVDGHVTRAVLTVSMTHTWCGDVTIKLRAPDGRTLTVLHRPGHPATFFGNSHDFSPRYPIVYADDAWGGIGGELMGSSGCPGLLVGPGTDACGSTFQPAPDGLEGESLADFAGSPANGSWTLYIGDSAGAQDIGTLDGWQLELMYQVTNPADLDGDGTVDGLDLAALLSQWTGSGAYAPCPPATPADLNGDCRVNGLDLALLLAAWG